MKGIVVGIKTNRVVMLERGGGFREIKNDGYSMGQEIVVPRRRRLPLAIAACLAVFLLLGIGGYGYYSTPQSYLYVDINPSLRLDVNGFGRVLSAVPLNEDAVALLEQCELDLSSGQDCVDSIIEASLELGYLNENHLDVELDLHTVSDAFRESVTSAADRISTEGVMVTVFELDQSQNETALASGISASRMRAVESYTEFFGGDFEANLQLLSGDTSQQIYETIRNHRRSTPGADSNAYTSPECHGATSAQGEAQTASGNRSAAYLSRREQAVDHYTAYFGGSAEDNATALASLTIGEIYEKIKTDRAAERTDKRTAAPSEDEPAAPKPSSQTNRTTRQALERRLHAIESYTEHFGGTLEENEAKLTGLSISQIHEAIRLDRTSDNDGRKTAE